MWYCVQNALFQRHILNDNYILFHIDVFKCAWDLVLPYGPWEIRIFWFSATCIYVLLHYFEYDFDSSVSIVTRLWAGQLGFDSWQRQGFFVFTTASRLVLGPIQPPTQWVPGVKWSGHEADHSPPSSAEVKNVQSHTSTPSYILTTWCLVKHRICLHGILLS
jgi:hypothetical protein